MKKLIFIILLSSCSNLSNVKDINNNINFSSDLSFNEYQNLLNDYNKSSKYPNFKND